jgi:hypothetical protein
MNQGIHNLSSDAYHADPCETPSLSSSIAKILLDQSPAHAWMAHPRLNTRFESEENSRFDLGSAAHLVLLERRENRIVRVAADDWRTKAAKEARDAARANGQYAILERQYVDVMAMCSAAQDYLNDTELADILATGDAEQTVLWQENNLWYRCRPDLISKDRRVILDYKTTDSAAPEVFGRQIGRMAYDLQAEFYVRGMRSVGLELDPVFVFLAQEITPPYACSLMALSNAYRAAGQAKVRRAMKLWERSLTTNNWPAYSNQIVYAEPNAYQMVEAELAAEQT